jgi:hypothetical protein
MSVILYTVHQDGHGTSHDQAAKILEMMPSMKTIYQIRRQKE